MPPKKMKGTDKEMRKGFREGEKSGGRRLPAFDPVITFTESFPCVLLIKSELFTHD